MSRAGSLALAAVMVGWNNVALPRLRLSARPRALTNGAVGAGLTAVAMTRYSPRELGLSTGHIPRGVRVGVLASAVPAASLVLAAAIPSVHSRVRAHAQRKKLGEWILLQIPAGTVLAEELMFRSVLSAVLQSAWPCKQAMAVHAATFGLWHMHPARAAGDNMFGTVAVTGASAVLFEELRARGDSVLSPALLHLTVNVGGALLSGSTR